MLHFLFLNLSLSDDNAGLAIEQFFRKGAFRRQKRKNDLRGNDNEDRNDGVQKRNRGIGQRYAGKLG